MTTSIEQRPDDETPDHLPTHIIRSAWANQYPPGTNLQDKARDSVIRYATHFGLNFRWEHDQYGELWRPARAGQPVHRFFDMGGGLVPTGVYGWASIAVVTGKERST